MFLLLLAEGTHDVGLEGGPVLQEDTQESLEVGLEEVDVVVVRVHAPEVCE